jgi:hypothetical protein
LFAAAKLQWQFPKSKKNIEYFSRMVELIFTADYCLDYKPFIYTAKSTVSKQD